MLAYIARKPRNSEAAIIVKQYLGYFPFSPLLDSWKTAKSIPARAINAAEAVIIAVIILIASSTGGISIIKNIDPFQMYVKKGATTFKANSRNEKGEKEL